MTNARTEIIPVGTSTPIKVNVGGGVDVLHILKNVGDSTIYLVSDSSSGGSFVIDNAITLTPGEVFYDVPNAVNDVDSSFLWALSPARASRLVAIY